MSLHHLRLNNARWRAVRKKVLDSASWRCSTCGKYGNEVDHIVPLHFGGAEYDESNLQCLCSACHREKTRRENESWSDPEREKWRAYVQELRERLCR